MAGRMRTKAIPIWAPSPPDISPARFREGAPPMRIRRSVERPARPVSPALTQDAAEAASSWCA